MTWKVSTCKGCGGLIEWILKNGKRVAVNFEGIGKEGSEHLITCSNPNAFKKPQKAKKTKPKQTKAQREIEPWWVK